MSKRETIHFQIIDGGKCIRPIDNRKLVYELHLHRATLKNRINLAFNLLMAWPIHLILRRGSEILKVGDREVSEIEL